MAGGIYSIALRDVQGEVACLALLGISISLQVIVHIEVVAVPLDGEDVVVTLYSADGFKLVSVKLL